MTIDKKNICLSNEDKEILKSFFKSISEWREIYNFNKYEDIKMFGDKLEQFINKNNLRNNVMIMTFLSEIRTYQLLSVSKNYGRSTASGIQICVLNDDLDFEIRGRISDWYDACLILNSKYVTSLNRGMAYRIREKEVIHQESLQQLKTKIFR